MSGNRLRDHRSFGKMQNTTLSDDDRQDEHAHTCEPKCFGMV